MATSECSERLWGSFYRVAWGASIAAALVTQSLVQRADGGDVAMENIALERSYTLDPAPNYPPTTDDGDMVQLTDGQHTSPTSKLWMQKEAVGWKRTEQIAITIDLGGIEPIRGVSFSTAAGSAGVAWPAALFILVSDDGMQYTPLGDLVTLSATRDVPPETGYATHRCWTDQIQARGRYVQILIHSAGTFAFVDEIEVYRGEDDWLNAPSAEPTIRDPQHHFADPRLRIHHAIQKRLTIDLTRCRERLSMVQISPSLRGQLEQALADVEQNIPHVSVNGDPRSFRAILPLNDLHAQIFAVHGAIAAAEDRRPFVAWSTNRWDALTPIQAAPGEPQQRVTIAAMRNELRSGAFNITNNSDKAVPATLVLQLSSQEITECIELNEVAWTDTLEGIVVAAALLPVTREDGSCTLTVPAGMTRQVWLNFKPSQGIAEGTHTGRMLIEPSRGLTQSLELQLEVFGSQFPQQPTLHVSGWDDTDRDDLYGLTPENVAPFIEHLRERSVDTPWATSRAVPYGEFADDGSMIAPPDTAHFDRWIDRWPGARRYAIFANVGDQIGPWKRGTRGFERAVEEWISFWVNHARTRGIEPNQILLLLVDEPRNQEEIQRTIDWAIPIRRSQPDVVIWTDPLFEKVEEIPAGFWEVVDVICPHWPAIRTGGLPLRAFYEQQRQAGRRLELYSCLGPALHLDPYSYHRLQAWECFAFDAEATSFWAFSDTGSSAGAWNPYARSVVSYCPLFLGPDSATAGKHMEAIREGVQDYEYLSMLRDRISLVETSNPHHPHLVSARELLRTAPQRVLMDSDRLSLNWVETKDRSVADIVRTEVAQMIGRLEQ